MWILWTLLGLFVFAVSVALIGGLICFFRIYYSPKRVPLPEGEFPFFEDEMYQPYKEIMIGWMREARDMEHTTHTVKSFDGLKLFGKLYEYEEGAPIEIMFHGYKGNSERDMCGGVQRCFKVGHSAFIVDQRAAGKSEGNVITFGINERKDCLTWIDYVNKTFPNRQIILTGISMGAATVTMAAGEKLPPNVVGVLADCGYSSPGNIIKKVIRDMGLPPKIIYPFAKLGARLYGGFNLEESSSVEALKRATVPVIFFHGEDDAFVPCRMSEECYDACASRKRLVKVAGAGHGLAYPLSGEQYIEEIKDFFG